MNTEKMTEEKEESNVNIEEEPTSENKKESKKLSKIDKIKAQLEESEIQLKEQKDKFLRLFAEFDNYKKRTSKERLELIKTAGQDVIIDLLPILDDFDRAEKSMSSSDDIATAKEGFQLIKDKMFKKLELKGLKSMESQGKEFDADFHEAITEIPAPNEALKGKVVDVIEKGYTLNDKIIRYAKVVVGK